MKNISKKNLIRISVLGLAVLGVFFVLPVAHAASVLSIADNVVTLILTGISYIVDTINYLLGNALIGLIGYMVIVSQWSDFIHVSFVDSGWSIVRDVVNMFFILALLGISFATVLKVESYSYQKLLPNLVIIALLVNFSKLIVGFVIDFFQVLMITFVNSYKDIAGGGFMQALHIYDTVKQAETSIGATAAVAENTASFTASGQLAGKIFGTIFIIVAFILICIFVITLIQRIVYLWLLTMLSPLAFFSYIFQGTGKLGGIYGQWKKQLIDWCLIGPFIAFILWISLTTAVKLDTEFNSFTANNNITPQAESDAALSTNNLGSFKNNLGFLIAVLMMIGGMKFSKEIAGAAGSMASANFEKQLGEKGLARRAVGMGGAVAGGAYKISGAAGAVEGIRQRAVRNELLSKEPGYITRGLEKIGGKYGSAVGVAGTNLVNKLGRFATKEGREESVKLRTARATAMTGGTPLVALKAKEELAKKRLEREELKGKLENPKDMQEILRKTDDPLLAMALSEKLIGMKIFDEEDQQAYRKITKGFLNSREQTAYDEKLEKAFEKNTNGAKLALSDIHYVASTGEMTDSKRAEIESSIANADGEKLKQITQNKSYGSALHNSATVVSAVKSGLAQNISNVSYMPEIVRAREAADVDSMIALKLGSTAIKPGGMTGDEYVRKMLIEGKIEGLKMNDAEKDLYRKAATPADKLKVETQFLDRIKPKRELWEKRQKDALDDMEKRGVAIGNYRLELGSEFNGAHQKVSTGDDGGDLLSHMYVSQPQMQKTLGSHSKQAVGRTVLDITRTRNITGGKNSAAKLATKMDRVLREVVDQHEEAKLRGVPVNVARLTADEAIINKWISKLRGLAPGTPLPVAELALMKAELGPIADKLYNGEYAAP